MGTTKKFKTSEVYAIIRGADAPIVRQIKSLKGWLRDLGVDAASFKRCVLRISSETVLCSTSYDHKDMWAAWDAIMAEKKWCDRDVYYMSLKYE